MDPVGATLTIASLFSICAKVSKTLYTYFCGPSILAEAIQLLQTEIEMLSGIIAPLHQSLGDPSFLEALTARGQQSLEKWRMMEQLLKDCEETLKSIESMLEGFQTRQVPIISQAMSDVRCQKVAAFGRKVAAYRQAIHFHLNLLTMFVLCM